MTDRQEAWLDHEKLDVYQEAVAFIGWLSNLLEGAVRVGEVREQLDRASTSILLNIAEGNGKYAPKDRCRYLDIAHGFPLECAAGLDILVANAKLAADQIRPGKVHHQKIVRMLMGLLKRNSTREYNRGDPTDEGTRTCAGQFADSTSSAVFAVAARISQS